MFDSTSRYYTKEVATYTTRDGRDIAYVRRRFLPRGKDRSLLVEVTVSEYDRLDLITSRTLGDPLQFWRVADANDAMDPFDLISEPGRTIRVAVPLVEA
jgi:hypothetical protein